METETESHELMHFQETTFGFDYGAAKVTRITSDDGKGWIILGVETKKHPRPLQIYVTKTGKVRVFSESGEWKPATSTRRAKKKDL